MRGRTNRAAGWNQKFEKAVRCLLEPLEGRRLLSGVTVYVDPTATGGADNGSSWANAYLDLQPALQFAAANATASSPITMDVAQGTYAPTTGINQNATFQLVDDTAIIGGFASGGSAAPHPLANQTVLTGAIRSNGRSYHVVTGSGTDASAVLEGVTITLGAAGGVGANSEGGGVFDSSGSPTLIADTFLYNTSRNGAGGGMFNANSSPTLTDCIFLDNTASASGPSEYGSAYGGAIYNQNSSIDLTNCTFLANSSYYTWSNPPLFLTFPGQGGTIFNADSSSATITNCIDWDGGNSFNFDSNSSAPYVTFSDISGGYAGVGNISSNPGFVDQGNFNVQLSPGSPCINTGSNAAIIATGVTTDAAGNSRIVGPAVDMGAFELQDASVTFTGAGDGTSWSDPKNWSSDSVPTSVDAVTIPTGFAPVIGPGAFAVESLTIQGTSTLDIGTGSLAIDYGIGNSSQLPAVQNELMSGTIFSSSAQANSRFAIGYADGSIDNGTAAQPGQVLVKFTFDGDATLNGTVNFPDLVAVIQNYNKPNTDWSQGNFNFGQSTNFSDLVAVIQNFNKPPPPAGAAAQSGGKTTPLDPSASSSPKSAVVVASDADAAPAAISQPPLYDADGAILQSDQSLL